MEERILKKTAVSVLVISLAACLLLPFFPRMQRASEVLFTAYREYRTKTKAERLHMTGLELLEYNNAQASEEAGGDVTFPGQLRLELPFGVSGQDLEVTQDYLTQTALIQIPYAGESYFYEHPVLGSSDHMESLMYESQKGYGTVELKMDQVYELRTEYDESFFYVDFLRPKELYDRVVVIDAGHGGDVPGATKQGVCEKDINLDILLKLKELFDAEEDASIGVYYTRTDDTNPDLEERAGLVNQSDADLLVSIHNNVTKSGRMSSINGTQVMYQDTEEEAADGAKELAQIFLEEVTKATGSSNKGLLSGSEVYIMNQSNAPAALIEVGFMTNQEELTKLRSVEYQKRAAQGIYNAILRALEEEY